jgi:glycosyltransferase involved in cell wall biosynthesis
MRRWTLTESPYHPENYTERVRRLAEIAMFIANSERTAERLREVGVAENRIAVRHLGVKVDKEVRKRSKSGGPVKIISVGRMVDFKGFDQTIRAYEKLCDKGVGAELHLVGDGYMGPFCRMLALNSKFHDKIVFHGVVSSPTVRRLLSESDIFTMHSQKGPITNQEEAFGVAFLEAMAEGLPVVTGRSGGIPETVVNKETGLLFPPGDIEAHAEALEYLCRDYEMRWRMGRVGFERVSKHFRFEDTIGKVCSLFDHGVK